MDKNTPLHQEHLKLKALMAPFAGWNMPIHYGSILDEARHTRTAVSLFDISHMGEFIIRENPSRSSLDAIVTIPVVKMKTQRCRYGFLLNENGKILDDLIAYRIAADEWMLVVNAANEQKDMNAIQRQLSPDASFENISPRIVKLDLQGPGSLAVLKSIVGDEVKRLTYYGFQFFSLLGGNYIISRTGYTGELGFEIYVDSSRGVELWTDADAAPGGEAGGPGGAGHSAPGGGSSPVWQ